MCVGGGGWAGKCGSKCGCSGALYTHIRTSTPTPLTRPHPLPHTQVPSPPHPRCYHGMLTYNSNTHIPTSPLFAPPHASPLTHTHTHTLYPTRMRPSPPHTQAFIVMGASTFGARTTFVLTSGRASYDMSNPQNPMPGLSFSTA